MAASILLKDRTEILAALPSGLKQYRVNASTTSVTEEVRELRAKIEKRTTWEFLPHAQKLYEWLIRPLEADLEFLPVDTLVFIPDGALRTIPMAALHDGKHFLVQKYAVAITPGLCLSDPRPIQGVNLQAYRGRPDCRRAGFCSPSPCRRGNQSYLPPPQRIPLLDQDSFCTKLEKELRSSTSTFSTSLPMEGSEKTLMTPSCSPSMTRSPWIGSAIAWSIPLSRQPPGVVDPECLWDRPQATKRGPWLAGVAVKAGARSALATLWHVNDPVSSRLVEEFYHRTGKTAVTRAMALQRAQLSIVGDTDTRTYPGYWAPFLLINNWL